MAQLVLDDPDQFVGTELLIGSGIDFDVMGLQHVAPACRPEAAIEHRLMLECFSEIGKGDLFHQFRQFKICHRSLPDSASSERCGLCQRPRIPPKP